MSLENTSTKFEKVNERYLVSKNLGCFLANKATNLVHSSIYSKTDSFKLSELSQGSLIPSSFKYSSHCTVGSNK